MNVFDALQLAGGIILSVGNIPQIRQLIRTKDSNGLNIGTFNSMLLGIGLMEVYAINLALNGMGVMFLITNTLALIMSATINILIRKYSKKPCK